MSEEPRQKKGRGLVDRKQVEAPSNFIAGRPKATLLFLVLLVVVDVVCGYSLFFLSDIKIEKC